MNRTYHRGSIYYADLGSGVGSEQEGYRPVVVIQNDVGNWYSSTVIIAPISSRVDKNPKMPTHCVVSQECGLKMPSVILLEQIRTVDKNRLGRYIGRLSEPYIDVMNHALAVSVALHEKGHLQSTYNH